MPEPTPTDIMTAISRLSILYSSLSGRLEVLEEQLDDLINKVDEINLPSGEGFSTYES